MRKQGKSFNFTKSYRGVLGAFVVICISIGLLCYIYYNNLSVTIRQESRAYLKELSSRIVNDVERIINDNIAILNTMAISVEEAQNADAEDLKQLILKQRQEFNYKEIFLIDKEGKAYSAESSVFLNLDDNVRSDILNGKPSMSTTQVINNQEYILFSVPINNVQMQDSEIIALLGCYDPASFNDVLSMTSFNEMSYSQIVKRNGTTVTKPTSPYAIKGGYNILSTLKTAKIEDGYTAEKLQKDLANDVENQIVFDLDDTKRYMVYTPVSQNDWYLLTFVPIDAVNQRSDMFLQTTLIVCGLITLAFSAMVASLVYVFNKHKSRLESMAYIDSVTGGNTMQRFYLLAEGAFDKNPEKQFALVFINIEKFKVMNEQMGRVTCDKILKFLNELFSSQLKPTECICRLFADNFCMLIEFDAEDELLNRFSHWYRAAESLVEKEHILWSLPTLQMGIYFIHDKNLPFEQMIDRAKLGLKETIWAIDNKLRYGFYDDEVRRVLFREKQLEDRMSEALAANEFKVYLQPKYRLPNEVIGGAEALVRWVTEDEGMIYPNEFIPLFEKNGFIVQLDMWVFSEVCRKLQEWKQKGYSPVKVSVNCSRAHFKDPLFLNKYINIADSFNVDKSLLEIELTESVVMENSQRLTQIISDIKSAGFGCSMDDFGSGYSSLNMLQSVPVDTLKLDKIFFNKNYEPERTEALIKSIVMMAESLKMNTVAEGVEIREQVEMLKRAGCHYIQGYVFARPMKIEEFEKLAYNAN